MDTADITYQNMLYAHLKIFIYTSYKCSMSIKLLASGMRNVFKTAKIVPIFVLKKDIVALKNAIRRDA